MRRDTVVFVPSQKLMENSIYTITVSSNLIAEGSEDVILNGDIVSGTHEDTDVTAADDRRKIAIPENSLFLFFLKKIIKK